MFEGEYSGHQILKELSVHEIFNRSNTGNVKYPGHDILRSLNIDDTNHSLPDSSGKEIFETTGEKLKSNT